MQTIKVTLPWSLQRWMRLVVSQEKVETAPFQDVENLTTQFQDFNSGQFYQQLNLTAAGCTVFVKTFSHFQEHLFRYASSHSLSYTFILLVSLDPPKSVPWTFVGYFYFMKGVSSLDYEHLCCYPQVFLLKCENEKNP